MLRLVLCGLIALGMQLASGAAHAQDYFSDSSTRPLVYKEEGSRTRNQKIVLASLFGGAVLAGVVGTYYLRESSDLSDALSASGRHTGKAWSDEFEGQRDDALRAGTVATVSYGVGGALLIGGIVAYIITAPDSEEAGYQDWQTHNTYVAPTKDGFVAGHAWSF